MEKNEILVLEGHQKVKKYFTAFSPTDKIKSIKSTFIPLKDFYLKNLFL